MSKNKRKISGIGIFIIVLFAALSVFAVLSVTVLFPIKTITVEGESKYSAEQIIIASKISVGNNILLISEKGISKSVSKQLPYIKSVRLQRDLTGNVIITVKPDEAGYSCKLNNQYVIISKSRKVLELKDNKVKNTAQILGVESCLTAVGEQFSIYDEKKNEQLTKLMELGNKYKLKYSVVDLSNISDLTVMIDSRLVVKLGTSENLDNKYRHLHEMYNNIADSEKGIIDLRTWSLERPEGYFRKQSVKNYFK